MAIYTSHLAGVAHSFLSPLHITTLHLHRAICPVPPKRSLVQHHNSLAVPFEDSPSRRHFDLLPHMSRSSRVDNAVPPHEDHELDTTHTVTLQLLTSPFKSRIIKFVSDTSRQISYQNDAHPPPFKDEWRERERERRRRKK